MPCGPGCGRYCAGALCGKSGGGELLQHRRFAVAGEAEARAQPPVIGEERAHQAGDRGEEKSVGGAEAQQPARRSRPRLGRDDVAHHQEPVGFQQPVKQREQRRRFLRLEILRDRMQHDEIERVVRQALDLFRRDHADLRLPAKRAARPARTRGAASHSSSSPAAAATASAWSASPQP